MRTQETTMKFSRHARIEIVYTHIIIDEWINEIIELIRLDNFKLFILIKRFYIYDSNSYATWYDI